MFPDTWLTDTVPISQEEVILTVRVSELMGGHGLMSLWLLFQSAIPEKKRHKALREASDTRSRCFLWFKLQGKGEEKEEELWKNERIETSAVGSLGERRKVQEGRIRNVEEACCEFICLYNGLKWC